MSSEVSSSERGFFRELATGRGECQHVGRGDKVRKAIIAAVLFGLAGAATRVSGAIGGELLAETGDPIVSAGAKIPH